MQRFSKNHWFVWLVFSLVCCLQGMAVGVETTDILFLIDGSESISAAGFALEKQGIINCFIGSNAFIPTDGSVAIGVIQFCTLPYIHVPMTVIDNQTTANTIATTINQIAQLRYDTSIAYALLGYHSGVDRPGAIEELRSHAQGNTRIIVVASDGGSYNNSTDVTAALQAAYDIRTGTGVADGMPPTMICAVLVDEDCACAAGNDAAMYLKRLANTWDSVPAPYPYPESVT